MVQVCAELLWVGSQHLEPSAEITLLQSGFKLFQFPVGRFLQLVAELEKVNQNIIFLANTSLT